MRTPLDPVAGLEDYATSPSQNIMSSGDQDWK